jgi:sterol desaturase/sphingolipid hydroxylase (fatty acid hydroxylase superfamily)
MDWVNLESTAYTIAFVGSFLGLAVWESWRPLRMPSQSTERRWVSHGILFAGSVAIQTIFLRTSPLIVAMAVANQPWGLLNRSWLAWPARILAAILLLDLVHYATHRLFHSFRVLWRVHEVHHSDPDYDVSTAARFHPIEVVGSKGLYIAAVAVLAPPPAAVFLNEVHTTLLNTLVHANVALPPRLESVVKMVFITPGLHRIHHSTGIAEQNCNFGQTFVWWDRLFGTYCPRPQAIGTGVTGLPEGSYNGTAALFTAPFKRRPE